MTKKYITLVLVCLLSLSASAYRYHGWMTLTLNENTLYHVVGTFDTDDNTVSLGNGLNACISHYEEGEIVIPSTYTEGGHTWKVKVGPMAFRFCTGITKVTIEEGVEHIGDFAFVGCSKLTNVVLPSTLKTIGSGAFSELASLRNVKCLATTAPTWLWNDVFAALGTTKSMEKMAATRILYVPSGATDSYLSTKFDGTQTKAKEIVGWQEAFNRIYELTDEPQTIGSLDELKAFRNAVNNGEQYKGSSNNSVVLTADIDLASETNWTPIGTESHPFDGVFDGGGHTIQNLCINRPEEDNVGLFGYARHATIYNLHLLNPKVYGHDYVGTLLGCALNDMRISDVLVTGTDSGDDYYTVNGGLYCGGIVGFAYSKSVIERCVFSGVIKGTVLRSGGILGEAYFDVTVSDCAASHHIQTNKTKGCPLGGIIGYAVRATVNRCMARNTLTQSGSKEMKFGYVIGEVDSKVQDQEPRNNIITNCAYWTSGSDINTVGAITENEYVQLTQSGNKAFDTEALMTGDAAKAQLGDDWTYFTGNHIDYPIPTTLKDMYMNHMVLLKSDNGLVYTPVGTPANPTAFEVCAYEGEATTLTIPDTYSGKPVTAILPEVFKGNSTLQTLTIGSNVTDIGASAFEDCDALTEVVLPDAVEYVHARAFRGCDNLTSFSIGKKFAHHDDNFIAYCPKLTTLKTTDGNPNDNSYYCEDGVLMHNTDIMFVIACAAGKTGDYIINQASTSKQNVKIFPDCFAGCTGLTSITLPSYNKYELGKGAFNGATNLRYINMASITAIDLESGTATTYTADRHDPNSPFYGLSQSTIVYLPSGHTVAANEPNIVIEGTANSIILTDGWDFEPPVAITATNGITYNRTLQATPVLTESGYKFQRCGYTVCLPYDLTLTATNAKVYAPTAVETTEGITTVTFKEVESKTMTAYTPYYLVVDGDGEVSLSKTGTVEIPVPDLKTTTISGSDFDFKGSNVTISNAQLCADANKPAYILQSDGNWHKVAQGVADACVGPFRAYFQANAAHEATQMVTKLVYLGDVNGDWAITVTDVMLLVNHILGHVNEIFIEENADTNGDGKITVTDVMVLVNMIFNGN